MGGVLTQPTYSTWSILGGLGTPLASLQNSLWPPLTFKPWPSPPSADGGGPRSSIGSREEKGPPLTSHTVTPPHSLGYPENTLDAGFPPRLGQRMRWRQLSGKERPGGNSSALHPETPTSLLPRDSGSEIASERLLGASRGLPLHTYWNHSTFPPPGDRCCCRGIAGRELDCAHSPDACSHRGTTFSLSHAVTHFAASPRLL